jgi:adenylosuccinate synthase
MRAFAIIGCGWGDEGKGAATDLVASHFPGALNIRHNGSGQAGHTVQMRDGRRHVFSHVGAGSFAGCDTYLGPKFVVNTRIFREEMHELEGKGVKPKIFAHPDCLVITPSDVSINRALERKRGVSKHGSTGTGFGEAIERSTRGPAIRLSDIYSGNYYPAVDLLAHWRWPRAEELGLDMLDGDIKFQDEDWSQFRLDCEFFREYVNISYPENMLLTHDEFIFEGAQGLLLDQRRGLEFPYVTRSNTGLQNVIPLCEQMGISKLQAVYMTRPYLTRHGAGPLPGEELWEEETKHNFDIVDETNLPGEWQGSLRFAPMDKALISKAISDDLSSSGNTIEIDYYSGHSCLDQAKKLLYSPDLGFKPALYGFGASRDKYKVEDSFIRGSTTYGSNKKASKN